MFELALLFVPKDVLNNFIDFRWKCENEDIPEEISSKYPAGYIREFMELDWHEPTAEWIRDFILNSEWCKGFNKSQQKKALGNIKKAIIIFGIGHPDLYDFDEDDWEEWKDKLLEANSRLPKQFQKSFDNSWISLHPGFKDYSSHHESVHLMKIQNKSYSLNRNN